MKRSSVLLDDGAETRSRSMARATAHAMAHETVRETECPRAIPTVTVGDGWTRSWGQTPLSP